MVDVLDGEREAVKDGVSKNGEACGGWVRRHTAGKSGRCSSVEQIRG